MASRISKEEAFDLLYEQARSYIPLFSLYFLGGSDQLEQAVFGDQGADEAAQRETFRRTTLWQAVDDVFLYAVDGVENELPEDIVIGAAEALSLLETENDSVDERIKAIVAAGDARFGLDTGQSLHVRSLAALASVDERTVRNAASAGELVSDPGDKSMISNASAREWLRKRRGFRPTIKANALARGLEGVSTPTEFATFIKSVRQSRRNNSGARLLPMHRYVTADAIELLEDGIFAMPIDACTALADFYELDRALFLRKAMEVFFSEELRMLEQTTSRSKDSGDAS